MYAPIVPINFQGIIRIPIRAVISPPVTYEIRFGFRLEKSLDGETTFAAIFVVSLRSKNHDGGKKNNCHAIEIGSSTRQDLGSPSTVNHKCGTGHSYTDEGKCRHSERQSEHLS